HYTDITDTTTLTAVKSDATIADHAATPVDTLTVSAINEGVWGDDISVIITHGTLSPRTEVDLAVMDAGQVVEIFRDLSMDESATNFVELKINEKSDYITIGNLGSASTPPDNRPQPGTSVLTGGDDGLTGITDTDYIGDAANRTGISAFDAIDQVNMLAVPGVTTAALIHAGITYCEGRLDCMLIAECPISLDPLDAVDFRKGQGSYTHAAFNSSYAALYYPWLEISDPVTSQRKLVPPAGAICGCYARSDQKTQVWYAPAGIDRGRIFNVLGLGYKASRPERDVLYPDAINVIASFPDSGINIWGQKTLQSQPSALDRV
ncbi:MAG: phage tail protein, partial [Propionibacteriaceae bacterium]|nr:phage tail protein [Propionibacteriaceae bacterium]